MKQPKFYNLTPARGQALLNFQGRLQPDKVELFETVPLEQVTPKTKQKQQTLGEKESKLNSDFTNLLIHGDCLSACAYLKANNIRPNLVYIDPPFASGANYAKKIYLRNGGETSLENEDNSIGEEIMYGDIWQKEDYLNWLYERLLAIREAMSEDATIYLHLSWHIGHYGRVLMDEVFGEANFRNEIIWHYEDKFATGGNSFDKNHDNIFIYSKSDDYTFHPTIIPKAEVSKRALRKKVNGQTVNVLDENGKKIIVEYTEKKADDVWDIGRTISKNEYEDYATQKPKSLLERIIKASSDEGTIVADFFSGSGVTAKTAFDLNRKFITCDIGTNAIQVSRDGLVEAGAQFDILKIQDGVRLFRNPAQTTAKIFSLIDGFKPAADLELSEFWDGGISGKKGSFVPVKFIGLDKKLTKELLDVVLEEIYQLEDLGTDSAEVKIIYAYKDPDVSQEYVNKAIKQSGKTTMSVDLVSLNQLLDQKAEVLFAPDSADVKVSKSGSGFKVEIKKYFSSYLKNKIDEYNAKKVQQTLGGKSAGSKIKLSDNGLELIESMQFDTTLRKDGVWVSNQDLEDKAGVKDKIKAVYQLPTGKFKIKIRNIAGDEITWGNLR